LEQSRGKGGGVGVRFVVQVRGIGWCLSNGNADDVLLLPILCLRLPPKLIRANTKTNTNTSTNTNHADSTNTDVRECVRACCRGACADVAVRPARSGLRRMATLRSTLPR